MIPGEGDYFAVKDEREPNIEHFIQFSVSLRGKPAILGEIQIHLKSYYKYFYIFFLNLQ